MNIRLWHRGPKLYKAVHVLEWSRAYYHVSTSVPLQKFLSPFMPDSVGLRLSMWQLQQNQPNNSKAPWQGPTQQMLFSDK
jgi:hypothetical protein